MKITKLMAENVKRLRRVEIDPSKDEPLVIVRGENGQGKSSILDAIKYAFAGKSSHPPRVIRDGERQACVEVETDELSVVRRWVGGAESTTTEVEVRSKDGTKLKSPQAVLDKLYDELAFDALEFVALKPREQLELLKKLVGVDTGLLDAQRQKVFEARTLVNRDLGAAEVRLRAMPADRPLPRVDTAALLKERGELTNALQWQTQSRSERDAALRRVRDCEEHVKAAEAALAAAKARLDGARKQASDSDNAVDDAEEKAMGASERLAAVDAEIKRAGDVAAANTRWEERERLVAEVKRLSDDTAAKTAALEQIDAEKNALVSGAKFPIEGLGFGVDGVLYKGLPFEQASQAEQLRVSVAVGAARKPKLRVMTVRDGSRLDKNGLKLLAELAREREIQIWLEAVGEEGPATVVIVDGSVRS